MNLSSWVEILFVALLAFIIIGPKDLPKVLHKLARFIQALRRFSHELMAEFETISYLKEIEEKKERVIKEPKRQD
ncbi:MAG: hypothetical protein K2W92_03330 [Alphaproteobacteria bacterium]|nr:hypothetical protein [Alphaproteobacteria bacterium]